MTDDIARKKAEERADKILPNPDFDPCSAYRQQRKNIVSDFIAGWEACEECWISVEDSLPGSQEPVLAWRWTTGEIKLAQCIRRSDGARRWFWDGTEYFANKDNISHWKPIKLPSEDQKEATDG